MSHLITVGDMVRWDAIALGIALVVIGVIWFVTKGMD